jgi:broad specificity phosphatase PhoE
MKKIYFVRHGESEGNAARIHQNKETPLSEIGMSQAKIVALRFSKIQVSKIIASPFKRAQQTAQAIADKNDLEIETSVLFSERRGPSQLIGLSQLSQQSKEIRANLQANILNDEGEWRHSDEENAAEFAKRAQEALDFLSRRPEENLVVVCHALILRMIFTKILNPNGDLKNLYDIYDNFDLNNTSISMASYDEGKKRWQMICINDHSHLG